eukprot:UN19439
MYEKIYIIQNNSYLIFSVFKKFQFMCFDLFSFVVEQTIKTKTTGLFGTI